MTIDHIRSCFFTEIPGFFARVPSSGGRQGRRRGRLRSFDVGQGKSLELRAAARLTQLQALTLAIANLAVLTALLGQRLTADQPVGETRMACCNSDSCGEGSLRWSLLQSHSVRWPPVENPDTEPGNQTPTGLDDGSWTPAPLRTGAAPASAGAALEPPERIELSTYSLRVNRSAD